MLGKGMDGVDEMDEVDEVGSPADLASGDALGPALAGEGGWIECRFRPGGRKQIRNGLHTCFSEIGFPAFKHRGFVSFGAERRAGIQKCQNVKSSITTGVWRGISRGGIWAVGEK
jgi:hypothetical protein